MRCASRPSGCRCYSGLAVHYKDLVHYPQAEIELLLAHSVSPFPQNRRAGCPALPKKLPYFDCGTWGPAGACSCCCNRSRSPPPEPDWPPLGAAGGAPGTGAAGVPALGCRIEPGLRCIPAISESTKLVPKKAAARMPVVLVSTLEVPRPVRKPPV